MHPVAARGGLREQVVVHQILQELFGLVGVGVQERCRRTGVDVGPGNQPEEAKEALRVGGQRVQGQVEHSLQASVPVGEPAEGGVGPLRAQLVGQALETPGPAGADQGGGDTQGQGEATAQSQDPVQQGVVGRYPAGTGHLAEQRPRIGVGQHVEWQDPGVVEPLELLATGDQDQTPAARR